MKKDFSRDKKNPDANIQPLSPEVINQISAGEVVERPANMIKELIENSLDAGAAKIEIHFSEGGRFVQIKDNGCGIRDNELKLALSPHSTSKISSLKDIWTIRSYGFRGEALASIAEVSDLTLVSKPKDQNQAARLRSEFGKKNDVEITGSEAGTTIHIKDLFKNTPARLKFLKSEASETAVIKNTIKAMALSHPSVEFRVLHKNKLLFYWPAVENFQKRVENVLSLKETFYTETKYQDVNVSAVLCAPNETSATRRQMWFFVQNRWVEDPTLYAAVMAAYRGLLMHGEYPILALNLYCRPEDLDVNVHPTKSKVRFKNSSQVFRAVQHSLRAVLEKAPWIANKKNNFNKREPSEKELAFPDKEFQQTHLQKKDFSERAGSGSFPSRKDFQTSLPDGREEESPPSLTSALKNIKMDSFIPETQERAGAEPARVQNPDPVQNKGEETEPADEKKNYWSSLHILSQAHLTYILAQTRSAVIFVDQHAAHERVLYERLMLSWNTGKGEVQNRLVPLALDLDESLVKALLSVQKELLKLGIEMELSGPEGVVINSAPAILKDVALQKSLVELAEEIRTLGGSFAVEKKISDLCATMACHSAIRAGQALSSREMKELLIQMDEFPLSSFCPHGRPVFVEYPISRLEKDFGRRL